jgi:hypothetical protein
VSFLAFHAQNTKQSRDFECVYFADGEGNVDSARSQKQDEQMAKKGGIWGIQSEAVK